MEIKKVFQSFGLDKEGRIRSVYEVVRGLACECICPSCGQNLIARQGDEREWHFAHASDVNCEKAVETALHLAAKQVLLDSAGMNVPTVSVTETFQLPDGSTVTAHAEQPELWIDFQCIEVEKSFGIVRPDIIVETGNEWLFVEIAVTHFVDEEKMRRLEKLNVPVIEIDLANILHQVWDWEYLQKVVVDGIEHKKWLKTINQTALIHEACEKVLAETMKCNSSQGMGLPARKMERLRFRVNGRMIDVIERPFGVAVWSPYDPDFNKIVKSLMQKFGGRWQSKFKNWLIPLEGKSHLLKELEKMSGTPPESLNS